MKVYGKPSCSKCIMLCRLLHMKKVEYEYIDITVNDSAFDKLNNLHIFSLPVLEKDDEIITNYDEIIKMFK